MRIDELNEDKVGQVLTYLAQTDERFAVAKVELEAAQIVCKRSRARAYIGADGTAAERNAEAELADEVQAADDALIAAKLTFEKLKANRERGNLLIDVWRSLEASRRRVL